jgi:hypothetical protein
MQHQLSSLVTDAMNAHLTLHPVIAHSHTHVCASAMDAMRAHVAVHSAETTYQAQHDYHGLGDKVCQARSWTGKLLWIESQPATTHSIPRS